MTTLTWDRHRGHATRYDVVEPGFNYRLDELRAAIGLVQLRRLDRTERRHARARRFATGRRSTEPWTSFPFHRCERLHDSAYHIAPRLSSRGRSIERCPCAKQLAAKGIQTSVHYPPIHRFTAYADTADARSLPRTDAIAERILTLPLFPHMTPADVDLVAEVVLDAVRRA